MALSNFDLNNIDGVNGVVVNGSDTYGRLGTSVSSAGDINGDGFDDFVVGAPNVGYDTFYFQSNGASYVVFGNGDAFPPELETSDLDGSNGFRISTSNKERLGESVSKAGDINGDGFDDLIVGAPNAGEIPPPQPYNYYEYSDGRGRSYVIFGSDAPFESDLNVDNIDGDNGFVVNGADEYDRAGTSVSNAGDINGDGFDDFIVGAPYADVNSSYSGEGQAYVVFGKGDSSELDLNDLDGTNGFAITGISNYDNLGRAVSSAGDFNGDGFDDLVVSAPDADASGDYSNEGQAYVVFGSNSGFDANLDLEDLDGTNGFAINGINESDNLGQSVSSGDINGDGLDDLIVGAPNADINSSYSNEGKVYVIFGTTEEQNANFDLENLDGTNGFAINGLNENDRFGSVVSSAGDFNGDGFDDLVVGIPSEDISSNFSDEGTVYLVYGQADGLDANIDLDSPDLKGLVIEGIEEEGQLGSSVSSAGDVNGDGFDDLVVGASNAGYGNFNYYGGEGKSYVIFGFAPLNLVGTEGEDELVGSSTDDILTGLAGDDVLQGLAGDDEISGNGGRDIILAGTGDDTVHGGFGNDNISGEAGNDSIRGNKGNDDIIGDTGNDSLFGNAGNDRLLAGDGDDSIKGGFGNDKLLGDAGNDFLAGNAGNDTIRGASGDDTIVAGIGADFIMGGSGNDSLAGNAGNDNITAGEGNDTIQPGSGDDTINGGSGSDLISGGKDNDILTGVDTEEGSLFGKDELDTLVGGLGQDTFVLGDTNNVYYDDGDSFSSGESDFARISDFDPTEDTIQLHGSMGMYELDFFNVGGSTNARLTFDPGDFGSRELIAVIENVSTDLSLDDPSFSMI